MRLEFDFTKENKEKFKDYLEKLDKKAKELNIKKEGFGIYSTKDELNYDKFILFTLYPAIIYENALFCNIYEDINNIVKVDAIAIHNKHKR